MARSRVMTYHPNVTTVSTKTAFYPVHFSLSSVLVVQLFFLNLNIFVYLISFHSTSLSSFPAIFPALIILFQKRQRDFALERCRGFSSFKAPYPCGTKTVNERGKREPAERARLLRTPESSYAAEIATALKLYERVMYVVYYV